jgi:hypothetical protein
MPDRSSWRTRYVSPSAPFNLKYRYSAANHASEHLRDSDATVTKNQRAWRLLAAMACVALDIHIEQALFRHLFIIEP